MIIKNKKQQAELMCELERLKEQVKAYESTLNEIAAWEHTGDLSGWGEPSSARSARQVLLRFRKI